MLKERVATKLNFETPAKDLGRLWLVAEEAKREQEERDGEGWHSSWEHFFNYRNFEILFETGGDALGQFGNRIGDLLRDRHHSDCSDAIRYYIYIAQEVMRAETSGSRRYVEAWQLMIEMKHAWLSAMEKEKNPLLKMREVISFTTDLKPENGTKMIETQAKIVLAALPEYRLVATEFPYPRKIEGLPENYPGKRNIIAHEKSSEHWWGLTWLAETAKERGLTSIYEKVNGYLLKALDNIDIGGTDGVVVDCLLRYYGESEQVTPEQKRAMAVRCLTLFAGRNNFHGEPRVVCGAIEVLLSLSDFEGAVSLWKQVPQYADEAGVLSSLMGYAIEHDLVERMRQEQAWFEENSRGRKTLLFSKWRLNWTFAARRVADKNVRVDHSMPEILEEVEVGGTDMRIMARLTMKNQEQTKFVEAVKARLGREMEKILTWQPEEKWEHYPFSELQECIEAVLILRGDLLT